MSVFSSSSRFRAPLLGLAGVAAAGVLFGLGFAVSRAVDDDDPPASRVTVPDIARADSTNANGPVVAGRNTAGAPGTGAGTSGAVPSRTGPATQSSEDAKYGLPYCQGLLPGIVRGGVIDPSLAGFAMKTLGAGFALQNISIGAQGDCDGGPQPKPEVGEISVNSSWYHEASGQFVFVDQRKAKPAANRIQGGQAVFSADGYLFSVSSGGIYYAEKQEASPAPTPPDTAKQEAVLLEAVRQLAPSLDQACFYREGRGTWADLAAMGIGDPRPAIPSDLKEQYAEFIVFIAPPASCNALPLDESGGFNASFSDGSGKEGFLFISAFRIPAEIGKQPGYVGPGGINWNNGKIMFSVNGSLRGDGAPLDVLSKIAVAMDPGYGQRCLVRQRTLTGDDLGKLGFREPKAPDGYKVRSTQLFVSEADPGKCAGFDTPGLPSYSLNWQMEDGKGANIFAGTYRSAGSQAGTPGAGGILEGNLYWVAKDGLTNHSVNGYGRNGPVDEDTLVAIAKSMDPDFDPSKLERGTGGPKPLPARDGAAPAR